MRAMRLRLKKCAPTSTRTSSLTPRWCSASKVLRAARTAPATWSRCQTRVNPGRDDGPRVVDLREKYASMPTGAETVGRSAGSGPDEGLERAEELYVGLAADDPLDHRMWEALARLHGRRNDLLGLEATVRRLR